MDCARIQQMLAFAERDACGGAKEKVVEMEKRSWTGQGRGEGRGEVEKAPVLKAQHNCERGDQNETTLRLISHTIEDGLFILRRNRLSHSKRQESWRQKPSIQVHLTETPCQIVDLHDRISRIHMHHQLQIW
jgi:hypothetical protein